MNQRGSIHDLEDRTRFRITLRELLKSSAYFFGRITRFACAYPPHIPAVGSVISPSRIFSRSLPVLSFCNLPFYVTPFSYAVLFVSGILSFLFPSTHSAETLRRSGHFPVCIPIFFTGISQPLFQAPQETLFHLRRSYRFPPLPMRSCSPRMPLRSPPPAHHPPVPPGYSVS